MLPFTLSFLCGDLLLQFFSKLPSTLEIILIFIPSLLLFKKQTYLSAFGLGFTWSAWFALNLLSWTLPHEWEGHPIIATGYIASIPSDNKKQTTFLFSLKNLNEKPIKNKILRLSWRDHHQHLKVGDEWQLPVKLKRIHGTQNPGGFDFESWALQSGISATGYIINAKEVHFVSHHPYRYPIDHFRQSVNDKIKMVLPHSPTSHWLMALILGERNGAKEQEWTILKNTGTNHLMAIAGLHIGILSGLAYAITAWIWRRFSILVLTMPAQEAGAIASLVIAWFYSLLSGFSIPTQRACIMLSVFIVTLLLRRPIPSWQAFSTALLIVLLLNPLNVLSMSFWLSFGTIAFIIYGMSARLSPAGLWWKWGRAQWVIGIGLMPLSLLFFQQTSMISFIANSIAIPWLGFFILPFCFLSVVFIFIFPSVSGFFLWLSDKSLNGLWQVLIWFSNQTFSVWHQIIPNVWIYSLILLSVILWLLPRGLPGRWFGFFTILPLIFYQTPKPEYGEMALTLLDVGQGLSAVVQTKNHLLVYDAGPKFGDNFDMGASVVTPYLRTLGTKKINMLIISHGDNDHIGGAKALLNEFKIHSILTSVPELISTPMTNFCKQGDKWEWDGVKFEFLYPSKENLDLKLNNDNSCVLKIENQDASILLTGDIEKKAEMTLVEKFSNRLKSTVLIVPHHGSKTSGLNTFLQAVHPEVVLYGLGYRNQYHFPHPTIVSAYQALESRQWRTDEMGAIFIWFGEGQFKLSSYRKQHQRYYHFV